jgi:hypothetical protein
MFQTRSHPRSVGQTLKCEVWLEMNCCGLIHSAGEDGTPDMRSWNNSIRCRKHLEAWQGNPERLEFCDTAED